MKVLLYGMQSSGASIMAYTFAQLPGSLAFIDIWNMFGAPELTTDRDCVAKVVVTTTFSLVTHQRRFRPDITILVLRHPIDNYYSLCGKDYANDSGLIDEKFAQLEEVFRMGVGFDHVLYYEDFAFSPRKLIDFCGRIGWNLDYEALSLSRSPRQIEELNSASIPGLSEKLRYGSGNVRGGGLLRDRVKFSEPWGKTEHLSRVCPALLDHYSTVRQEKGASWYVPGRPLLSCSLSVIVRGREKSGQIPKKLQWGGYTVRLINSTPHCRVNDKELILCPEPSGKETQFTISGLPGEPFNRVSGSVVAEHPLAQGTAVRIGVEDRGRVLKTWETQLSHADMQNFELEFPPKHSIIEIRLCVSILHVGTSSAHDAVSFRELRLEQFAG